MRTNHHARHICKIVTEISSGSRLVLGGAQKAGIFADEAETPSKFATREAVSKQVLACSRRGGESPGASLRLWIATRRSTCKSPEVSLIEAPSAN